MEENEKRAIWNSYIHEELAMYNVMKIERDAERK